MSTNDYISAPSRCGSCVHMPSGERWRVMQEWRSIDAASLHAATGKWKHGQFDWHVFSFGHARSLSGSKARQANSQEQPCQLLVIPESEALPAFRLAADLLPDLFPLNQDLHVFPSDLSWTMSFTHEMPAGAGPYFSRREWME